MAATSPSALRNRSFIPPHQRLVLARTEAPPSSSSSMPRLDVELEYEESEGKYDDTTLLFVEDHRKEYHHLVRELSDLRADLRDERHKTLSQAVAYEKALSELQSSYDALYKEHREATKALDDAHQMKAKYRLLKDTLRVTQWELLEAKETVEVLTQNVSELEAKMARWVQQTAGNNVHVRRALSKCEGERDRLEEMVLTSSSSSSSSSVALIELLRQRCVEYKKTITELLSATSDEVEAIVTCRQCVHYEEMLEQAVELYAAQSRELTNSLSTASKEVNRQKLLSDALAEKLRDSFCFVFDLIKEMYQISPLSLCNNNNTNSPTNISNNSNNNNVTGLQNAHNVLRGAFQHLTQEHADALEKIVSLGSECEALRRKVELQGRRRDKHQQ